MKYINAFLIAATLIFTMPYTAEAKPKKAKSAAHKPAKAKKAAKASKKAKGKKAKGHQVASHKKGKKAPPFKRRKSKKKS